MAILLYLTVRFFTDISTLTTAAIRYLISTGLSIPPPHQIEHMIGWVHLKLPQFLLIFLVKMCVFRGQNGFVLCLMIKVSSCGLRCENGCYNAYFGKDIGVLSVGNWKYRTFKNSVGMEENQLPTI